MKKAHQQGFSVIGIIISIVIVGIVLVVLASKKNTQPLLPSSNQPHTQGEQKNQSAPTVNPFFIQQENQRRQQQEQQQIIQQQQQLQQQQIQQQQWMYQRP